MNVVNENIKLKGNRTLIQLIVAVLLYFVIFFGISFILNMLLRRTWLMSVLYPIIMIMMLDGIPTTRYFTAPSEAFAHTYNKLTNLYLVDYVTFLAGFLGTVVSGIVIKLLRKSGYQMF